MKKNNFVGKWAIVTGASKGLGFAYVEEFLKLGLNVIGVARNTESLSELAKKYPDLVVEALNIDLSRVENCEELARAAITKDVAYFVNNAGYGVWGYFLKTDIEAEMNMIDLNIKTLHTLTKIFIKKFDEQGYGRVLNVGSLAAFVPGPVFSSYYASKAYVYSLGVAVNTELKKAKSKARIITICPGPLKTDFWNRSSDQKDAKYVSRVKVMKTSVYARKSLKKALTTRKDFVIVGMANKITKWFSLHAPKKIVLSAIYNYQKSR